MTCSSKFVSSHYIHKLILLMNICIYLSWLYFLFVRLVQRKTTKRSSRRENHRTTPRQRCCSCWVKLVAWTSTTSLRPDLRFKVGQNTHQGTVDTCSILIFVNIPIFLSECCPELVKTLIMNNFFVERPRRRAASQSQWLLGASALALLASPLRRLFKV